MSPAKASSKPVNYEAPVTNGSTNNYTNLWRKDHDGARSSKKSKESSDPPDVWKWDDNHVHMPCSPRSRLETALRWPKILKELEKLENSPDSLYDVIASYNQSHKRKWNYTALDEFRFQNLELFKTTVPMIARLAKELPDQVKDSIPLLRQGTERSLTLSQQQIASILANAFLCTFPLRNDTRKSLIYEKFPSINFSQLFGEARRSLQAKVEKIKCLFHYFKRVATQGPTGCVTYTRRHISHKDLPKWKTSERLLPSLNITCEGSIETDGPGMLQVDFANKLVGGGVLGDGSVQEEIRFATYPELIASRLFMEELLDNEAMIVVGSECYSQHSGYAQTFKWEGDFQDKTESDSNGRKRCAVVAIDALQFKKYDERQFSPQFIDRELNKAFVGFSYPEDNRQFQVATGNWGCGVYNGDPKLKLLIQLLAAGEAGRSVKYFTMKDARIPVDETKDIHETLHERKLTIGKIYDLLGCYGKEKGAEDLFSFLKRKTDHLAPGASYVRSGKSTGNVRRNKRTLGPFAAEEQLENSKKSNNAPSERKAPTNTVKSTDQGRREQGVKSNTEKRDIANSTFQIEQGKTYNYDDASKYKSQNSTNMAKVNNIQPAVQVGNASHYAVQRENTALPVETHVVYGKQTGNAQRKEETVTPFAAEERVENSRKSINNSRNAGKNPINSGKRTNQGRREQVVASSNEKNNRANNQIHVEHRTTDNNEYALNYSGQNVKNITKISQSQPAVKVVSASDHNAQVKEPLGERSVYELRDTYERRATPDMRNAASYPSTDYDLQNANRKSLNVSTPRGDKTEQRSEKRNSGKLETIIGRPVTQPHGKVNSRISYQKPISTSNGDSAPYQRKSQVAKGKETKEIQHYTQGSSVYAHPFTKSGENQTRRPRDQSTNILNAKNTGSAKNISSRQLNQKDDAQYYQIPARDKRDDNHPTSTYDYVMLPFKDGRTIKGMMVWNFIEQSKDSFVAKPKDKISKWCTNLTSTIMSYSKEGSDFVGLHLFSKNNEKLFKSTMPKIVNYALDMPQLFQKPIPLLRQGSEQSLRLNQRQIASILANAFLCTFQPCNDNSKYSNINFRTLFSGDTESETSKIKCIFHYFDKCDANLSNAVTFTRKVNANLPDWKDSKNCFQKLRISSKGRIGSNTSHLLQVIFSNKLIGKNIYESKFTQEVSMFFSYPELIVAKLFTEELRENEALFIEGCEQYCTYKGKKIIFDVDVKMKFNQPTEIVAIDARIYSNRADQFHPPNIVLELNKAYSGFSSNHQELRCLPIASGNWQSPANLKGDSALKALIQLMAAAESEKEMVYYITDDVLKVEYLQKMHQHLCDNKVTVGNLFDRLCTYRPSNKDVNKTEDLFRHVIEFGLPMTNRGKKSQCNIL